MSKGKAKAWELVVFEKSEGDTADRSLHRLKVPGGWLVAHEWTERPGGLVFVPDSEHKWNPWV